MVRLLVPLLVALSLTARPAAAWACTGDCNADGVVTINEVISGVNILLGAAELAQCTACDRNGNGVVSVDELVGAVLSALGGCPATPTPTPSTAPSATAEATATALDCDTDGVICTVAGTGMAQFDGDGRQALDTSLYFPLQVVFDRDGQPLVLDYNNLRLRRINRDGTVSTIMGTGEEALPMEGALAIDTPLHHASDVHFDTDGRLYVAGDHVSVVFRVDVDQRVYTVAGNCQTQPDDCYGYTGDRGPALQARLSTPVGALPDAAGGFYISDVDTDTVRHVNAQGTITTVAGTGVEGYAGDSAPGTAAQLADPRRLTIGPDGALYFCESKNHVVRRLRPDGTIETFAGTGVRGYSGDGRAALQARLDAPYDVHFAPNGDAYVTDTNNNVVRRIDGSGIITTVVGNGDAAFAGDGRSAADCALRRPQGVTFDGDGSMWIADTGNHRVRRVWHYLQAGALLH